MKLKQLISVLFALSILFLLSPCTAQAQTGACATEILGQPGGVQIIVFEWTASAGGVVSGVGATDKAITGHVTGASFDPGSGVSDLYDVQILDGNGVDILRTLGSNLPSDATSTANYKTPLTDEGGYQTLTRQTLTPSISGAGNATSGTIYLWVE